MRRPVVSVLRTRPDRVLEDYHTLMNLAGYQDVVAKEADTALKINISWHFFFPGSSANPVASGQIDPLGRTGVRALLRSIGILGTCLREAPEFAMRRRRSAQHAEPSRS